MRTPIRKVLRAAAKKTFYNWCRTLIYNITFHFVVVTYYFCTSVWFFWWLNYILCWNHITPAAFMIALEELGPIYAIFKSTIVPEMFQPKTAERVLGFFDVLETYVLFFYVNLKLLLNCWDGFAADWDAFWELVQVNVARKEAGMDPIGMEIGIIGLFRLFTILIFFQRVVLPIVLWADRALQAEERARIAALKKNKKKIPEKKLWDTW